MRQRRFPRTLGVVVALYLVAMACVFGLLSKQDADFARGATRTEGVVVALVARAPLGSTRDPRPDARSPSLAPKVSYAADGRTYEFVSAHGRYRQRLQIGDKVVVLYSPTDPANARLRGEGQVLGPVISVGFALAAAAVVVLLARTRSTKNGPRTKPDASRTSLPPAAAVAD